MTGDGGAMRMPWPVRFFYEVCGKAFPPPVYQNLLDDSNKYRKRKADMGDFLLLKPHALVDLIKKNAD